MGERILWSDSDLLSPRQPSIGSSIESSIVNLFMVLTGIVNDMYTAVFISPSLSSLRFLLLLLSCLIYSDDPASCHVRRKLCSLDSNRLQLEIFLEPSSI